MAMWSLFLLLGLLLVCTFMEAQSEDPCRKVCPKIYSPVCGETRKNGQLVRCKFSNSCLMGVSGCVNRLTWCGTDLSKCKQTSNVCNSLGGS
ncbi:vasotab [Drosophila subobscura]|uniref:vasotab n=1 Tax=Drosophila subobscura TaxID=7241 RepID=UPI00155AAB79|nr:vasotab [Drosophila subobscura]